MPRRGIVVSRIDVISKIAAKAINCMRNSAFLEGFGFRGLQIFTRAAGELLQTSQPGIRDFVSRSNYIQKPYHEFTRWVPLYRCLLRTKGTFGHFDCGFTVLPRRMTTDFTSARCIFTGSTIFVPVLEPSMSLCCCMDCAENSPDGTRGFKIRNRKLPIRGILPPCTR